MKIVTIIGARPQFIKAAVVSHLFAYSSEIEEIIVHTGQHFDSNMSDVFFEEMSIPVPHYNLNINDLGHGAMTGQMLEKVEDILLREKPDWVLVYGDTNSTLAGALAAKKLHIRVAHVEAGLRSFNMDMPEEINRILTDRISDILFCPTETAVRNLYKEGFEHIACRIVKSGDVMLDAALFYRDKVKNTLLNIPERFILSTVHRAENTDNPELLKSIFDALEKISEKISVVLPLHPRTRGKLLAMKYDFCSTKICFIDPVGYLEMVWLLKNCEWVMTDSGGLQKEAYFFEKYCVTMRRETEWIELVENGFNILSGTETMSILDSVEKLLLKNGVENWKHLYGDGGAGKIVLTELLSYYRFIQNGYR